MSTIQNIPIGNLYHNPNNPRRVSYGDLEELADSIRSNGILQNLSVVAYDPAIHRGLNVADPADSYIILIGNRRYEGAKKVGLTHLPCAVLIKDAADQMAIMTVENCQRENLTPTEEAWAFQQLSLFGKSVDEIAEMTGFSKTKVRNRIKLTELDEAKVQAASERGATLSDYAKLNSIKDLAVRNKLLDQLATPNFEYYYKRAKDEEKNRQIREERIQQLSEFATHIDASGHEHVSVTTFYNGSSVSITKPDDADTVSYYFVVGGSWIELFRERTAEETQAVIDKKAVRAMYAKNVKELEEIHKRMHSLRYEFVKGITQTAAKKFLPNTVVFAMEKIEKMSNGGYTVVGDEHWPKAYHDFFGLELEESGECDRIEWETAVRNTPELAMLITTYMLAEYNVGRFFRDRYSHTAEASVPMYEENQKLDDLYCWLEEMGFVLSDEEKMVRNGTHSLYYVEPVAQESAAEQAAVA